MCLICDLTFCILLGVSSLKYFLAIDPDFLFFKTNKVIHTLFFEGKWWETGNKNIFLSFFCLVLWRRSCAFVIGFSLACELPYAIGVILSPRIWMKVLSVFHLWYHFMNIIRCEFSQGFACYWSVVYYITTLVEKATTLKKVRKLEVGRH